MADPGVSFIASLAAGSVIEGVKAGIGVFRAARAVLPPQEEQRRRDSLASSVQDALTLGLRDIAANSPEWTALMRALETERESNPALLSELLFTGGRQRGGVLSSSKWREAAGVDPDRYDGLVEALVAAVEWAVALDEQLSHFVTFKMLQMLQQRMVEGQAGLELVQALRKLIEEREAPMPHEPATRFAVPFGHREDFFGRAEDLGRLREMLRGGKPVAVIGLTGIGGIGKTRLAAEYAHRYQQDYPGGVYWVNAAVDMVAGMADCAWRAGLSEEGVNLSDLDVRRRLAQRLYRWLQGNPQSLLILDNIADPGRINEPLFGDLVLLALPCQTLFTTRSQAFDDSQFPSHQLDVLPRPASLRLLLRGESRQQALAGDHPENQAADGICEMLGDLALALEQAGGYLAKWSGVMLTDYRDRLNREGAIETADDTPLQDHYLATRHRVGVNLVLQDSVKHLNREGNALKVLRMLAEFAEAEMVLRHRVALAAGLSHEPRRGHVDELSVALEELTTASLVETLAENRVRLHPLVWKFARSLTPRADRDAWSSQIARNLVEGLGDVEYLERRVVEQGILALLEDLVICFPIIPRAGADADSLHLLHRLLDLEAPSLATWEPALLPGFFLQQVRNRALELRLVQVQGAAEQALKSRQGIAYLLQSQAHHADHPALVRCLEGHERWVWSVAFSPDGQRIASGSDDGTVRLWDAATGKELARFRAVYRVEAVSFLADDRILAADNGGATNRPAVYILRLVCQ